MKRLVRSKSGRQIHGQKWQNTDRIESIEISQPSDANTNPTSGSLATLTSRLRGQNNEAGSSRGSNSDRLSMYRAALVGDWLAAEVVLARDSTLAVDHITEEGDRALHVAVALKHEEFVRKLVQLWSASDLQTLLDGRGYTASCYAAVSGIVEIADILMKKNPNLVNARDANNATPLHKALLCGNRDMVLYFLKFSKLDHLSKQEWFDLLLVALRTKMYDVALEIFAKDGSLATMRNEEGTPLHALARLDISYFPAYVGLFESYRKKLASNRGLHRRKIDGEMEKDLRLLAERLWAEIQKLEQAESLDLVRNPPLVHEAAKMGNVELITMLTHTYPNLTWDTDNNGHTIFHIAVMHRRENVFRLIYNIGAIKHLASISTDDDGNNISHLAAKLAPHNRRSIVAVPALQMQAELAWFKEVEATVPPSCLEVRNKEGLTAREIFSMQHKSLLEKSETWMRNTADSCMLIATIMLTVVFTAAFTVPGGNNQDTGIPILLKAEWFTCFIIFEALALFGSTLSIIMFWSIMTSSFEQDRFLSELPFQLKLGLAGLLMSLVGAISAFLSAYFLVFVQERALLVKIVIIWNYVFLLVAIGLEFFKLMLNTSLQRYFSGIRDSLSRSPRTTAYFRRALALFSFHRGRQ